MKKQAIQLISEKEYKSDTSITLFEDEYSFSFGKIELDNICLKFGWNSKDVEPDIKFIDGTSLFFIGVDVYVVAYDYKKHMNAFYLNTSTNFKWFDEIENGIAIVSETGVVLINTTNLCTLRNCFFFSDIIMGTKIEKNKIKISFLIDDDEVINV